jgi:RES domain-containing protein
VTIAWRIIKEKYKDAALSGEGARIYGGRWNEKGHPALYLSDSLALAALETFVHLGMAAARINYISLRIDLPDEGIDSIDEKKLSSNWRTEHPSETTQSIGAIWLKERKKLALKVPSILVPVEYNYLVNPEHKDFKKLKIVSCESFYFDPRMWKEI